MGWIDKPPPSRAEVAWLDAGVAAVGGLVGLVPGAIGYKAAGWCPADEIACLARAFTIGGGAGYGLVGGASAGVAHAVQGGRHAGVVFAVTAGAGVLGAVLEAASLQIPPTEADVGESVFLLGMVTAFIGVPVAAGVSGSLLYEEPPPQPGFGWTLTPVAGPTRVGLVASGRF